MTTPVVAVDSTCVVCGNKPAGPPSEALAWGLGWGLELRPQPPRFFHWGDNNGEFHNFAMGYVDGDGVVVFTNSGNGHSIMPEIIDAALGGPHPAFAWMGYDSYKSPARQLLRDILARGPVALEGASAASLPESRINAIGYVLLQKKRLPEAIAAFERNVRRFPESWNAYDSLGEAYAAAGDREKAIAAYQRSLDLNPQNANAAAMLKTLRGR